MQKKSNDFICAVCGDHAIGFNYNAFSCAPCKIFFRRNANQNLVRFLFVCLTIEYDCFFLRKIFDVYPDKDNVPLHMVHVVNVHDVD